MTVATETLTLH